MNKLSKKTIITRVLAVCMVMVLGLAVVGPVPAQVQAADGREYIPILLNGRPLEQNDDIGWAQNVDGRVMVPLRLVSEALGFTVGWQTDGPQMISMRGHGQSVFHRLGTLYARPALTGWDYVAQTDVPSFVDRVTDRTMVGVRLVAEAFNDVDVDWDSVSRSVILTTNFPAADPSDQVWLDDDNYVLRSQVINRIAQHQVIFYDPRTVGLPWFDRGTRTLGEQARHWEPFIRDGVSYESVIGRRVLVERATGFLEGHYTINYRTMTTGQWLDSFESYVHNLLYPNLSPENLYGLEQSRDWFARRYNRAAQQQQLIMRSVFVTDESLVHVVPEHIAVLDNTGEIFIDGQAPWAVRGTLFYKFESIVSGSVDIWLDSGYQIGQWYWVDIEVRFGLNTIGNIRYEVALTGPEVVFWLHSDGASMEWDHDAREWKNSQLPQSLSTLPR